MTKIKGIDIPEPCQAKWENMQVSTGGRFCSGCSKTVIDFTTMPDKDIIDYLSRHQKVCGRFYDFQLSRVNYNLLSDRHSSPSWRKIIAMACIAGLISVAKVEARVAAPTEHVSKQEHNGITATDSAMVILRGRVIDKVTRLPVEKAFVTTDKKGRKVKTNSHGEFVLKAQADAQYIFVYPSIERGLTSVCTISSDNSYYELTIPYLGRHFVNSNSTVTMGEIRTTPGQKFDKTIKIRSAREIGKLGDFDEQKVSCDSTTTNKLP